MSINRIPSFILVGFLLIILLNLTSCSIQKRVHLKGWNIEWNKKSKGCEVHNDVGSSTLIRDTSQLLSQVSIGKEKVQQISDSVFTKLSTTLTIQKIEHKTFNTLNHKARITLFQTKTKVKSSKNNYERSHINSYILPIIIVFIGLILTFFGFLSYFGPSAALMSQLAGILTILFGLLLIIIGLITMIAIAFSLNDKQKRNSKKNIGENDSKEINNSTVTIVEENN